MFKAGDHALFAFKFLQRNPELASILAIFVRIDVRGMQGLKCAIWDFASPGSAATGQRPTGV